MMSHAFSVDMISDVEDRGLLARPRACLKAMGNSIYVALSSSQCLSSSSKAPQYVSSNATSVSSCGARRCQRQADRRLAAAAAAAAGFMLQHLLWHEGDWVCILVNDDLPWLATAESWTIPSLFRDKVYLLSCARENRASHR